MAGEGSFELNFTAKIRKHPPPQATGTVYYPMDVDDVLVAGGSRPDRLLDVSWTAGAGSAAHRGETPRAADIKNSLITPRCTALRTPPV